MIQLSLYLILGAAFLLSLYVFARRSHRAEGGAQVIVEARRALLALQLELLPPAILGRIFEKKDFEYVLAQTPRHVQELFLKERQRIAISWVAQIRKQILSLKDFHLGSARFYARLNPWTEFRVAFEFFILLNMCRAVEVAVRWRGPYAAPRMVGRAAMAAARVCDLSEVSLDFLKGSQFETSSHGTART